MELVLSVILLIITGLAVLVKLIALVYICVVDI
jgi:hypothetical protein